MKIVQCDNCVKAATCPHAHKKTDLGTYSNSVSETVGCSAGKAVR